MKTGTLILAMRYAKALDRIAKNTDEAARNLASFEDVLKKLQDISVYLANPTINSKVKENLIEKSLPDNIARAFLVVLIKEKRFNLANEVLNQLNALLEMESSTKDSLTKRPKNPLINIKGFCSVVVKSVSENFL